MRATSVVIVGVVAAAVGVLIEGTSESPFELILPFIFGTGVLDMARRRDDAWARLCSAP